MTNGDERGEGKKGRERWTLTCPVAPHLENFTRPCALRLPLSSTSSCHIILAFCQSTHQSSIFLLLHGKQPSFSLYVLLHFFFCGGIFSFSLRFLFDQLFMRIILVLCLYFQHTRSTSSVTDFRQPFKNPWRDIAWPKGVQNHG